jgi:hypothetical protein
MTLGNMRANGVRWLAVSCWQCHHQAILSADPWPDHTSAIVRPAHGVHPVRHHRCGCPAELAGAAGAAQRRWHCAMAMSERPRVLEMLAGSSLGCTEAMSAPGERRHPSAGEVGGL